jgi:CBS domain-containing protein
MEKLIAKDIMSSAVITVRDDLTVGELASFLTESEISGAPVVDSEGRLVGVVSLADIARNSSGGPDIAQDRSSPEFFVRGWEEQFNPEDIDQLHIENQDMLVRDVMRQRFYTVSEEASVSQVADTMVQAHVHRLLVTRDEEVAGIISSLDLLKLLI